LFKRIKHSWIKFTPEMYFWAVIFAFPIVFFQASGAGMDSPPASLETRRHGEKTGRGPAKSDLTGRVVRWRRRRKSLNGGRNGWGKIHR
jgi:hypothetical protein